MHGRHIDYCVPILNHYAIVIQDAYSKFPEVFLTTNATVEFSQMALEKVLRRGRNSCFRQLNSLYRRVSTNIASFNRLQSYSNCSMSHAIKWPSWKLCPHSKNCRQNRVSYNRSPTSPMHRHFSVTLPQRKTFSDWKGSSSALQRRTSENEQLRHHRRTVLSWNLQYIESAKVSSKANLATECNQSVLDRSGSSVHRWHLDQLAVASNNTAPNVCKIASSDTNTTPHTHTHTQHTSTEHYPPAEDTTVQHLQDLTLRPIASYDSKTLGSIYSCFHFLCASISRSFDSRSSSSKPNHSANSSDPLPDEPFRRRIRVRRRHEWFKVFVWLRKMWQPYVTTRM